MDSLSSYTTLAYNNAIFLLFSFIVTRQVGYTKRLIVIMKDILCLLLLSGKNELTLLAGVICQVKIGGVTSGLTTRSNSLATQQRQLSDTPGSRAPGHAHWQHFLKGSCYRESRACCHSRHSFLYFLDVIHCK